MAEALGVSRETFDRAFEGVAFDPKVVAETQRQAEFTIPIWTYIGAAATPDRIARGRDKALEVAPWLAKASRMYGVDPGILMGIWGLETDFGAAPGSFDVVRSLASLAFVRFPRRLFPQRTPVGAGDPPGGRHRSARDDRIVGGRHGPDAIHAIELSRLRRRFRGRGPARYLDERSGRDRLDRQLSGRAMAGRATSPGVSRSGLPARISRSPTPIRQSPRRSPRSPRAASSAPTESRFRRQARAGC